MVNRVVKQTLLVNHHQLYIEVYGDRGEPTIILLHHGLGTTAAWIDIIPQLVNAGYRVIAYDRWGYGRSEGRKELSIPYFLEDIEDLKWIIDHLCDLQVILIGHSDGGTMGLDFASKYPEKVRCLVCVAAHIYVEPKMLEGIQSVFQQFQSDDKFQRGLQRVHFDNYPGVFHAWYSGWMKPENIKWDLRNELSQIRCPCLIIQGTHDQHATLQHAIDLADSIEDTQLWIIENAGHMIPKESAQELAQGILSFVERKCLIKS